MASYALSATTCGAHKHSWTKISLLSSLEVPNFWWGFSFSFSLWQIVRGCPITIKQVQPCSTPSCPHDKSLQILLIKSLPSLADKFLWDDFTLFVWIQNCWPNKVWYMGAQSQENTQTCKPGLRNHFEDFRNHSEFKAHNLSFFVILIQI